MTAFLLYAVMSINVSPVVPLTESTLEEWIMTRPEVMTSDLKPQPGK